MYQFARTSNGIRIVTERVPYVQSVSLGIWVDTGGRDETDSTAGISHFIEHLLFKGTERRSAQAIAEELDAVGGQINAFTDKEYTCYYVKALPEHVPPAQDRLADMLQHSLLDPEEEVQVPKPTEQVHFCLGTRGYNQNEEDRYALGLLDSAIGGGMSSRLLQEVREKRGLCYSIGSYTASFREAGMFTVYAGT